MLKIILLFLFFFQCTMGFAADKLSLNFKELELSQALKSLSEISGTAIILEDSLQGTITLKLEADNFQEALELICEAKGLSYRKVRDTIFISANPTDVTLQQTVSYPLSYRSAPELAAELKELFSGKLISEAATNTLLFKGNPKQQRLLGELLGKLDIPCPQVSLEAKIIAINEEASKALGVRWAWDSFPSIKSDTNEDKAFGGHFKVWKGNSFSYSATINALITEGKAKIIANPRILTLPGKEAIIFIGDHIPVQTEKRDSSGSYTSTEYVDAGIKLKYTPIISRDNKFITAKIHTEVATASLVSEMTNYKITSRTADTNLRLANKETLVIGGLINEEEQKNLQKVPLLGDIPLVGNLFRSHNKRKSRVEVIMLLTPHIIIA